MPATEEIEADGLVDIGRLQEPAQRNGGIEILGPPPFEASVADFNDA